MKHVRPHEVFNRITTDSYFDRLVRLVLPGPNVPLLFETSVLVALCKLVNCKTFFEFGTWLGIRILNIAANLDPKAVLYTLDLDEESAKKIEQETQDRTNTVKYLEYMDNLAFKNTSYEKNIVVLRGDSTRFDYKPYYDQMDLVFVDGGHDLYTVRADTENAFKLVRQNSPHIVAWHDYGNPKHPQLTEYLEKLSNEKDIHHIEETTICYYLVE